jgi:hypothetical protein
MHFPRGVSRISHSPSTATADSGLSASLRDDFAPQHSVNDAFVAKSPRASALREGGVRLPEEVVIRCAVARLQSNRQFAWDLISFSLGGIDHIHYYGRGTRASMGKLRLVLKRENRPDGRVENAMRPEAGQVPRYVRTAARDQSAMVVCEVIL